MGALKDFFLSQKEKPRYPPIIDGSWEVLCRLVGSCCPPEAIDTDLILLSTRWRHPGMLKRLASAVYPKGVRKLSGATVTVVRINNLGQRRMAKPCQRCMTQLRAAGIRWIVYSTDSGWERERL